MSLFDALNELVANDSDLAISSTNPSNDQFEVGLSDIDDPGLSTSHTLRYRYQKDAARQIDLTVDLVQGTTIIATFTHLNIAIGFVTAAQVLTGPQADAITDYTDLRIRFNVNATGGGAATEGQISWAEFEVPLFLSGTIVGQSTLAGSLIADAPLSGAINAQSLLTGTMFGQIALMGTVVASNALQGSLNIPRVLQGSLDGQSFVVGALPVSRPLAAAVPGISTAQGRILLDQEIGGVIAAVSVLSGTLRADFAMKGTIPGTNTSQASLSKTLDLVGISNSFSALPPAMLTLALSLRINTGALSSAQADLILSLALSGVIDAQSALDGRLRFSGEQITTGVGGKAVAVITVGGKVAVINVL